MSKVLVTGGAGYIGVVLTKELIHRGYDVRILDKMYFGSEPLNELEKRVEIVQGDIRNFDESILKDVKQVIHLASLSNDPTADFNPKANHEMNTIGTRKLAEMCAKKGINRLTYASSASIYDKGINSGGEIQDEESEVTPKTAYSTSKYEGEVELLKVMEKNPDFSPVILRQGTVYGYSPRMRFDLVVNTMVKSAFTNGVLNVFCNGSQWRPLVDVKDVSKAHISCLEAKNEDVKGEIFNVCEGNYQMIDLAHRIKYALKEIIPVSVEVDYGEDRIDRSYQISGSKLENVLGFRYNISPEEAAVDIAKRIKKGWIKDLENPINYNIRWMEFLVDIERRLSKIGNVF